MRDGQSSEELRSSLVIKSIREVIRTGSLHWFGHMERKDENDQIKLVKHFEVSGTVTMGRLRKTWNEALKKDAERKGIDRQVT